MKNYKLPLFLIVLVSLAFCTLPCRAEGVSPPPKPIVSKNDKRVYDPSEAAVAGYKVGQTVMVKTGIIYKLAQDTKTGRYSYKRYRVVKKKKTDTRKTVTPSQKNKTFSDPSKAAAAGYKVGQTVMMKNGIIYKLAQDAKTGSYAYKRYRIVKKKKIEPPKVVQADAAVKTQAKTQVDESLKERIEVKAQEGDVDKARREIATEAKRPGQEQAPKDRVESPAKSWRPNGRNMSRLTAAIAFRHAFLDRETVLTDRRLTDAGETTSGVTGGSFSTDMHSDLLRLRLGLTNTMEVFLDAGFAYDKLSDISDIEPAFGGGFRVNVATVDSGFFSGVYLAFSGEYLQGKLSTSYNSSDGTVTSTTGIDWRDITATMESGITFSKISVYTGCSYMLYSEEITTKEINSIAGSILLEEELEQKSSLNFSCGVEYHYSPSLNLQLEIQAPNRLGGIVSAEYRF